MVHSESSKSGAVAVGVALVGKNDSRHVRSPVVIDARRTPLAVIRIGIRAIRVRGARQLAVGILSVAECFENSASAHPLLGRLPIQAVVGEIADPAVAVGLAGSCCRAIRHSVFTNSRPRFRLKLALYQIDSTH